MRTRGGARPRAGQLAVPADRLLRLPVGLPHRRARRTRRHDRVAVRAALRLAERLRLAAGPRRRRLPARPLRHDRPRRAPLRAGHQHRRDDVDDAVGLARRARRAGDRPVGPAQRRRRHAHAPADRRRRRARAGADDRVHPGQRPDRDGLRADVRLRPRAGRVDDRRRRLRRRRRPPPHRLAAADERPADRDRGQPRPRPPHAQGGREEVRRAVVGERPARAAGRRGGVGDARHTSHFWRDWLDDGRFPDHPGGSTCSARRSC